MEFWGVIVAILLGALIGLQREFTQQHIHLKMFAGFRTFILITFLGAILGFLSISLDSSLFVIVGFVGVILLSLASYYLTYLKKNISSATTEFAAIISYVLGVMCTIGYLKWAVVFGILVVAFLSLKRKLHDFAKNMNSPELYAVVKFALLSLVVLPFLPNKNYSPEDIPGFSEIFGGLGLNSSFLSQLDVFNFYHIWLMVVLVAGISFVGYFLIKFIGSKKGYGLLGFVGGLVSSTAVTLSMSEESKRSKKIVFPFVLATIIATSVMFVRVIFEVAIVNSSLLPFILPSLGVMALVGFGLAFLFYTRRDKKKKIKEVEFQQPFAIIPALKFGLFFALILLVSKIAQIAFGSAGIYGTSILSGLADVDAITLTMSSLSKSGAVSEIVASTSIILATVSNTLVKAGIALFLGKGKYGKIVLGLFSIILAIGLLILFLF